MCIHTHHGYDQEYCSKIAELNKLQETLCFPEKSDLCVFQIVWGFFAVTQQHLKNIDPFVVIRH